ncbi:MAG: protein kinase [Thermoguttaceae bacterium]|jgi:tetratricopeptide (TPR) repeat protein/predicted Ser/Thr protein kinase|nr:protein kinase [Thermoguttaceae bacterium]
MRETDDTRDHIEILAEEFVERYRRGERPSVAEYASAYPAWADRIRELFPTILALENVKPGASGSGGEFHAPAEETMRQLGDFRIVREVGRGGMGVVYEAVQESLGRRVALKVLPESYSSSSSALRRFRREAQAAARLHHPNIVSVFGVGEHEGRHFYVMEYIEGRDLDAVFNEIRRFREAETPGAAPWRDAAAIGVQAAAALHYAHQQGTLHRDVKPGNLILDRNRNVWITDFGLAKLTDQDDLTQPGDVVGTLRYMAPEQLEGRTDVRSDVYSLGLTLYELLTLRRAFEAPSRHELIHQVSFHDPPHPRTVVPDIPRDLETIVLKAIAREPGHRYQTAGELADDLQRFLDDRPIRARRISSLEHAWRWCRRNPALATSSTVALLLLIALAAGMATGYVRRTQALARESQLRAEAQEEGRRAEANLQLAAEAFDDVFAKLSGAPTSRVLAETSDGLWYVNPPTVSRKDAAVLSSLLEFYDRFAKQNRDSRRWQVETALAFRRMGDIHQLLGRLDNSETAYRRAAEFFERLHNADPDRGEYRVGLAGVQNELGRLSLDRGDFEQASRSIHHSLELLADDGKTTPATAGARFELARTYHQLSFLDLMRQLGPERTPEVDGAPAARGVASAERALALLEQLSAEDPGNGEYRLFMARCYGHLWGAGRFAQKPADPEQRSRQDTYAEAAVGLLEQLVSDFPENPHYQAELALTYAITSHAPAAPETARQAERRLRRVEQAVGIAAGLSEAFPEVPHYRAVLALCSLHLTHHLWAAGRQEEATDRAGQAVALGRAAQADSPTDSRSRYLFARALHTAIRAHELRSEWPAVRPLLEELIELESVPAGADADTARVSPALADAYALLAEVLEELGEPAPAAEAARKAAELKPGEPAPPRPMRFGPLDGRLGERSRR